MENVKISWKKNDKMDDEWEIDERRMTKVHKWPDMDDERRVIEDEQWLMSELLQGTVYIHADCQLTTRVTQMKAQV